MLGSGEHELAFPRKTAGGEDDRHERVDVIGSVSFLSVHLLAVLLIFLTGFSWVAFAACLIFYFVRMFGITAGYHRYFAHRSFKTSRAFQFALALLGASSAQCGPLWWAGHHRYHHRHSDKETDIHSPKRQGTWWAHIGWILCKKYVPTNFSIIQDFAKYPELRWINRFHMLPSVVLATCVFSLGELIRYFWPSTCTTGFQFLAWGFFVSTVLLYHGTFTINSLAHKFGFARFQTQDESRNNFWLSLITLGEGWHNNHHRFPQSERQGFTWWQIDVTHFFLRALAMARLVWDLKTPPREVLQEGGYV